MAVFPFNLLSLIIVSLAMCAIGFYRYRYFLSIGRSLATAGAGLTIACLYAGLMTFPTFLLCFIICLYGLLLTAYSIYREMKMKPKEAAAIFDSMTDNFELVAKILNAMDTQSRGNILGKMDSNNAAKVTKIMNPTNTDSITK